MVKSLRCTPLAVAVAVTGLVAFLFASNHCALGGMALLKDQEHSCCRKDGANDPPRHNIECCTSLKASLSDAAAAPVVHLFELMPAWHDNFLAADFSKPVGGEISFPMGGPPGARTFVEMARSLLMHAPPVFAV